MTGEKELYQKYYVYECRVDGVLRYIGMGKGNRYKHCYSGKSHVSELNRDFHAGKDVSVVKVREGLTKLDAMEFEMDLVGEAQGLYNKETTSDFSSKPDHKRSENYTTMGSLKSRDNKEYRSVLRLLGNKADAMTTENLESLKQALSECGLDIFLVKYQGTVPVLLIDRFELKKESYEHLACFSFPNCHISGCVKN